MKQRKKIGLIVGCLFGILCLGFLGIMIYKKMEKTYPYSYYCVKTSYVDQEPRAILVKSPAELQKCFEDVFSDRFDLGYSEFRQVMEKYDEKYFEDKMLVLVLLGEMNDAIRPEVTKVSLNKQNKLEIQIDKTIPKEEFKEEYAIEIKSDFREERYEIHLAEGIVCGKNGQAYLEPDSLEYKAIEDGIQGWKYTAARNGIHPDTSHLGFSVQYVYTGGNSNYVPKAIVIRSAEELQQYFNKNMVNEDGEESYYAEGFRTAIQKFDEEYFKNQVLVVVEKGDSIAAVYYDVTKVSKNSNGELEIVIEKLSPEVGDTIISGWHFFIEIAEEMNVTGEENIKIVLDGEVVEYPVLTMQCPDGTTYFCEGQHAFWMKSELFHELNFRKTDNSVWVPEYIVTIESDVRHEVYEINLTERCVRYNGRIISLDDRQKANLEENIKYWLYYMEKI